MSEQTHEPDVVETMEISVAGAEAAKTAETKEEAQEKMETAMEEKARELRVTLSPDTNKQVAREVIRQLDEMGAFRREQSTTNETSDDENTDGGTNPKPGDAVEEPPHNKNWIQRIVEGE